MAESHSGGYSDAQQYFACTDRRVVPRLPFRKTCVQAILLDAEQRRKLLNQLVPLRNDRQGEAVSTELGEAHKNDAKSSLFPQRNRFPKAEMTRNGAGDSYTRYCWNNVRLF